MEKRPRHESGIRQELGTNDRKHTIGLRRSCYDALLLPPILRIPSEEVRITLCTFEIRTSSPQEVRSPSRPEEYRRSKTKVTVEKKSNRAGATHFFGFQPPKKFVGSHPPSAQMTVPAVFSTVRKRVSEQVNLLRRTNMPLIKKQPAILTRSFALRRPSANSSTTTPGSLRAALITS